MIDRSIRFDPAISDPAIEPSMGSAAICIFSFFHFLQE